MTILQALDRYYDRLEDAVAPGWSNEPIGVVLELASDGTLLGVEKRLNEKNKPKIERVPKWFTKQGQGSTPFFLWDNPAYVLGLGLSDPGKAKDPAKTARDHAAFKQLHAEALAEEQDEGLLALRRFLEALTPETAATIGLDDKLLAFNIGFRLRGETRLLPQRPAAAVLVERLRAAGTAAVEGFCLIRGERLPLVRLHPKVKGVDGTSMAEVPLVSFNIDSFESYGKDQGYNAPTSVVAAFRYGAALNQLLTRGGRNRLRIGDASIAFWADARALDEAVREAAARQVEDVFAGVFDDTPLVKGATDEQQSATVREALERAAKGRADLPSAPVLMDEVEFFVLGLAPNAARLSVRYWLANSFAAFADALDKHRKDVSIGPAPWGAKAPSVQRLLVKTTALLEKFDNIPNGVAGEVMRAVLTGAPYPRTWLAAAIIRLRAGDDPARGWHAAAIKACINRPVELELTALAREGADPERIAHLAKEKLSVTLEPDNPSPAYQLGRLFAVLEAAQYAALGRVNASIADRYYGAASATPARVFGALLRGAKTHISDAGKRGKGGWIEPKLGEIIARLPPDLPKTLRLEDQGRFAVGYYHERASRPAKADDTATGEAHPDDKAQS